MKLTRRSVTAVALAAAVLTATYHASNWWEREFATLESSAVSPDGCMRIETWQAYRVLPSEFHIAPHPDPAARGKPFRTWAGAYFKRAYEIRTGKFLGETVVFDPSSAFDVTIWNDSRVPGRRIVLANGFPMVDSDRCADDETMAKLDDFYRREWSERRLLEDQRTREAEDRK